ncbi:MFS transporter [Metabacillus litoralis]|uniref:MFS transporter n=1 Tax=Metabacillus TaxID=2675233 RepID=UPI001B999484|nr:MFS transporter [Metabacillus litoralis]MCM3161299.1 MFS transporter [Metabacillus litoralis]MCM3409152.1 MFS transporter [Metabacillus litoralis]UHA59229.1 MFS transporter [Metabacillus litoralis]
MGAPKKLDLLALSSVPLVMTLGNSMLIPVLPLISKKLNISAFQVSLIITVYSIVAIILIPIAGYLSDRFGRKIVMVPCLIIAGVGGAVSGWASWKIEDPYIWILIGRVLQGIGSAGAAPVVMPLVGDMFKSDEEISAGLGLTETANTAGKVLSPIIGAALAAFLWFLPFWFIPFFSLVSVLLVAFLVKVPKTKDKEVQTVKEFAHCVKGIFAENGKWLFAIFAVGCIIMFVLFGILFFLSDMLEKQYNINGVKKGLVLAIPLLALSISSFISGKKIGQSKNLMKTVIIVGMGLVTISFIALRVQHTLMFLISFLVLTGIGIGITLPSLDALITEGIEKEERGTITSIYSAMRFIGVAAGPPVYSYLMSVSEHLVYYISAGSSVIAVMVVLLFIQVKDLEKDPKQMPKLA